MSVTRNLLSLLILASAVILPARTWAQPSPKAAQPIAKESLARLQFTEGVAGYSDDVTNKYGYVDQHGLWVIQPRFIYGDNFSEGLAAVVVQDGKSENGRLWGFIDKTGKFVINPQFDNIPSKFSEGRAAIVIRQEQQARWQFIDRSGKVVIPGNFQDCERFSNGLAPVCIRKEGKRIWGFIDLQGKFKIGPCYSEAKPFQEGLAAVRIGTTSTEPSDLSASKVPPGLWGYIDPTGAFLITPQFSDAGSFSEGLAPVEAGANWQQHSGAGGPWSSWGNGKWGYINTKGAFAIQPRWIGAKEFKDGYAMVSRKGSGFLESRGTEYHDFIGKDGKTWNFQDP